MKQSICKVHRGSSNKWSGERPSRPTKWQTTISNAIISKSSSK
jgi:hypothetical protein